tara:strand:+ start:141 stop:386 length:246 start_codon:yes stop_codon:yes gene_type:complete
MIFIIVIIAFILAWFFIEITLFLTYKDNNEQDDKGKISYKKFVWYLRLIGFALLLLIFLYMHYSGNINFEKAIQYCLGILK